MKNIAVLNPLLFHKKIVCQGFKGRGQFIGKFRDWGVETIPLWGKEINIERGTQSISILQDATIAQKFRYCAAILWLLPLIHNYLHLSTPRPKNSAFLYFPLSSAAPAALVGRCWVVIKKLKTIQFQSSQNHQPRCLSPKTSAFLSFPFPCPWQLWLDEVEWYWSASAQHPPASGQTPSLHLWSIRACKDQACFLRVICVFVVNKSAWVWLRRGVAQTEAEKEENDLGLRHLRSQWGSCYIRFRFDRIHLFMAGYQMTT